MNFNIIAVMETDNSFAFNMQTHYVPRMGEQIEVNGMLFVVKYVRYKISNGSFHTQNVQLGLVRTR